MKKKTQKFVDILVACIFSSEMKHCIKHSTKVFCATKIEKLSIPTSIVQYKQLMGIAKDCLLDSKLHDVDEICILYYFHKYIIGLYQIKY